MINSIQIKDRIIGAGQKPFIIAEMSGNLCLCWCCHQQGDNCMYG
ncbi:MAG: hypothetical protein ACR2FN_13110 [Chitinophagaceae bacterium]